ncbi:MAG: methylated-DNA--[protein]-cysteine S-methyltransferase [Pseudonocardiaceae bacterium]|nr:methylated-DNA--[protein]-cysteine S-methyltransferase [Pseudonocardiaceae bacterium]
MRVQTPIGPLVVAATEDGLAGVAFGGDDREPDGPPEALAEVRRQLEEYFAGRRRVFELPLDWSSMSPFHRQVLRALFDEVGFGHTATYGELAALVGHPDASRAVGIAMATNPIPIVVPCHRVVASGGQLGGFGGGLETKRWLLTHEGVLPPTLFPINAG